MSSTTPGGPPALSQKVKFGLLFGVKNKVDMVFALFIRRAQGSDVFDIREMAGSEGARVAHLDKTLDVCDGVMVACGDLHIGILVSYVFLAQKMMIAKCKRAGKPVFYHNSDVRVYDCEVLSVFCLL